MKKSVITLLFQFCASTSLLAQNNTNDVTESFKQTMAIYELHRDLSILMDSTAQHIYLKDKARLTKEGKFNDKQQRDMARSQAFDVLTNYIYASRDANVQVMKMYSTRPHTEENGKEALAKRDAVLDSIIRARGIDHLFFVDEMFKKRVARLKAGHKN